MLPTFHVKPSLLLFCIFVSIHKNLTEKVFLAVSIIDLVGERGSTKDLTIYLIRLLLSKFSQFSITSYGALEWGGRDAHLKFCSWDRFLKKLLKSWWSFVHFTKIIVHALLLFSKQLLRNNIKENMYQKVSWRPFEAFVKGWNSKFSLAVQPWWTAKSGGLNQPLLAVNL